MAGNAQEIEEIKMLIRGLLISVKTQMTVEDLRKDFKRTEGRDIPFRKLGFNNIIEFLRSIPDTVLIEIHRGIPYVLPVVEEKIAHIEALVSKQKTTNKSIFYRPPRKIVHTQETFGAPLQQRIPKAYVPPPLSRVPSHFNNFNENLYYGHYPEPLALTPHPPPPYRLPQYPVELPPRLRRFRDSDVHIPKYIQQHMKELLCKYSEGFPVRRLDEKYKEMFNVSIPVRDFGFHSLTEFALHFESMEICHITDTFGDLWIYPTMNQLPSHINHCKYQLLLISLCLKYCFVSYRQLATSIMYIY